MSQTAKRFNLIDQEYVDFIQSLMSKTVAEPIAGLRASAAEALAAPAGELVLAKEDLVRAAQELDGRLTARLTRAVDTLESVSEELGGVGTRLDELVQEGGERRQLVQEISASLEKLRVEITAGTETLTRARDFAGRLAELQAGLEDRWPEFERSLRERWMAHAESQSQALVAAGQATEERIEAVISGLGKLQQELEQCVLTSRDRLSTQWQADFTNLAKVQVEAAERLDLSLAGLHQQWSKRFEEEEKSGASRQRELSQQVSSGLERMDSGLKKALAELVKRLAALDAGQSQSVIHLDGRLQSLDSAAAQKAQRLEERLAALQRQVERRISDNGEQVAAKMSSAESLQQELAAKLHEVLSLEQVIGDQTTKKFRELEHSLRTGKRFLLATMLLCGAILLAVLFHH